MVNALPQAPSSTESKILEAAKKVFIRNGFDGTSMQHIANEAGINKSLLHYYFRSKEKLFSTVFLYAFQHFVPQIQGILSSEQSLPAKIECIVAEYMDMLMNNEIIPAFILHEINRNPDRIYQIMKESGLNPGIFIDQFAREIGKDVVPSVDPRHFIVNIISLPIAGKPLIQRILFANDSDAYHRFLTERKSVVTRFIIQSIQA
jgi:TetR/AcrR family transcriptional regulator